MAGVWTTRLASLRSEVSQGCCTVGSGGEGSTGVFCNGEARARLGWRAGGLVGMQTATTATSKGGGRQDNGRESLAAAEDCGSRQVGDDVWEKQRTRGLYDEGLKKAAKGDALAGMERCHPGKEGPPESSWAGAGHSLLLHHRHHGKTSTTAPPRPQPAAHSPHTQTLRHLLVRVCRPGAANPPACGLAATSAATLVAAATACRCLSLSMSPACLCRCFAFRLPTANNNSTTTTTTTATTKPPPRHSTHNTLPAHSRLPGTRLGVPA
ncbi:hypothetical protein COCC4DRAFT_173083 [Bipolaris maydis ATCC 48331]|uniref:Uncharacterized protein n=2 Tax=Cochliobolus heterostrophus TaxID=5016 RepID=M2UIX1_COCH5|nr:uncharacterized protein COCC4DRAFT_173083 [Bipolaris maydis ATCC 48331]EMD87862.1 hypothetical protein COCHEDRAFT_1033240 [Bipolaris maydis C5]KAJ5057546.1 hypothetical protein J3E74DRAFT_437839 [Bipolaris maydis]ENI03376.1 hypothetical protein COCC4DRAFT_173083 [Bipolaris maydis ATCC 48331]KAJ6206854.1 hypothetical protein PSV09DRAFT_1033240 [Bipolaris maydis]KAJ6268624.1 hypothetical protein PSV08DRAFT_378856 [Bipolaris maydis]